MKKLINSEYFQGLLASLLGSISICIIYYVYVMNLQVKYSEVNDTDVLTAILKEVMSSCIKDVIFAFILIYVLWVVGKKLSFNLGLNTGLHIEKKGLIFSCTAGVILSVITILGDKFIFEPLMGTTLIYNKDILSNIYLLIKAGFVEEVYYRLGAITILSFAIKYGVFGNKDEKRDLSLKISAIFVVIVFFLMNFMNVTTVYFITPIIVIKGIVFYIVPSLVFSFIYIKKGLVYSIISHIVMLFVTNVILTPILLLI